MYVKKIKQRNGTHYLHLVEAYRENKKIKHRKLESLGILEILEKENPNILSELKEKYKKQKSMKLFDGKYKEKNYGYFLLQGIYESLGINRYLNNYQDNNLKIKYSLDEAMKLLVFSRILKPGSKLATFEHKEMFFDNFNIEINDLYRSLSIFNNIKEDLQFDIHTNLSKKYGRDCTLVFYDVTNYYFEIHENDMNQIDEQGKKVEGFRKNGMGKDGKRQPLVVMGLVMDNNNIPVAYQLFKGNEADTKTLIPIFQSITKKYNLKKIVLVGDKGINSENNLNFMVNEGNGYIVSQKARGQTEEFTKEILRQDNYLDDNEDFKYKSIERERILKCEEDRTKDVKIKEKVVFIWSKKYHDRMQHKRKKELEKIKYFIKNQKQLVKLEKDLKPYIIEKIKDKSGKKIKDAQIEYEFDEAKFKEACELDGYYILISSETYLTECEIRQKYKGLLEIENCFRILKSDFEGRPVYVWSKSRIEGHFLICFIALTIMRILQKLLHNQYSVAKLQDAINSAKLHPIKKDYFIFAESKVFDEILKVLNLDVSETELSLGNFLKYKKQFTLLQKNLRFNGY